MAQPDRKTKLGERDHVLLAVLFNTGARIAEALNVRLSDIRLDSPAQVRVWGKGRKERISPLWPETVELLVAFLKRNPVGPGEVIFRNRYGNPLGASGVRFRLKRYLQAATQKVPRLSEKRVSPHTLRHTAAVTCLPRASMPPSSGTGWATLAWTRQTFTHKPTWRRNDRPSKKLMVCCGRRRHLVGSGTPICWHGSTPSEPVAHGQGDIVPTCRWPVRRNYGEQKRS
jgi:integrase